MMIVIALALLPLAAYTAYLGSLAWREAETFRAAPHVSSESVTVGTFAHMSGPASADFLNPVEFPEVKGALQYQVHREQKDDGDGWSQVAVLAGQRIEGVRLGHLHVELTAATRVLSKPIEVQRHLSETERLKIQWVKGEGEQFTAFGIFDGKKLTEGRFQRVYLIAPEDLAMIIEVMDKTGKIKSGVLAFVALITGALAVAALRAARAPQAVRPA